MAVVMAAGEDPGALLDILDGRGRKERGVEGVVDVVLGRGGRHVLYRVGGVGASPCRNIPALWGTRDVMR